MRAGELRSAVFAGRVAGVFGTRVVAFLFAVTGSLLMSRWLDRGGQGIYTTVITAISLLFTLGQLGLPSAVTFFAGRGRSVASLRRQTLRLTIITATAMVAIGVALLPAFLASVARSASATELLLGLLALPILLASSLGGAILYGRQAIRNYNIIQVGQAIISFAAIVLFVGALNLGVIGAITAFLLANGAGAAAVLNEVRRLDRRTPDTGAAKASLIELVRYGMRLYPASITSYFNYRADVLILNLDRVSDGDIGLYGRAVNFAELLFYVPDSIGTIFYPTIAGSTEREAHEIAPAVARLTMLLALIGGLLILPAAYIVIAVVLPRFVGSMIPLVILVPGMVSLSMSKVLSSYTSGLGRPGAATIAAGTAMIVNIALNLWLIPLAGIAGAALASLVSYTVHAAIMVSFASQAASLPIRNFLVPGKAEARRLGDLTWVILGVIRRRANSRSV